mmetsp:Transcript_28834/g.64464  ORF Transcript_28834/g.64464 Transcript_28834/m.64464 type:complete len:246 (-) Transcript_28834:148-885(-)
MTINQGQRDERAKEPVSFKKVLEKLFPRPGKGTSKPAALGAAPAAQHLSYPGPAPGQERSEGNEPGPKFGAVPPPPEQVNRQQRGGSDEGGEALPWYQQPGAGADVVAVEGLGRINPFGGGVTVKELKEAFALHGRVVFVDYIEQEGRAFVRFADAQTAAACVAKPTPLLRHPSAAPLVAQGPLDGGHPLLGACLARAQAWGQRGGQRRHVDPAFVPRGSHHHKKAAAKGARGREGHYGPGQPGP